MELGKFVAEWKRSANLNHQANRCNTNKGADKVSALVYGIWGLAMPESLA